jgi:hypothetical protein
MAKPHRSHYVGRKLGTAGLEGSREPVSGEWPSAIEATTPRESSAPRASKGAANR